VSAVLIGIVVVAGLVLAGVLISRAADREQRHLDEARAAARAGRATIVEVAATNSAVTSPGVRREGYRFVLDVVEDDAPGEAIEDHDDAAGGSEGGPADSTNASGEGGPADSTNASGEGGPVDSTNASGEGGPVDSTNASGEGGPVDSAGGGGTAGRRRVSVVWYVPAMAVPQLQPGEVVPIVRDRRDERLTWCEVDGVEPDRHTLVQALRDLT